MIKKSEKSTDETNWKTSIVKNKILQIVEAELDSKRKSLFDSSLFLRL
jgi:hypothetical protein